ncbi:MAG: diphosphomevalonate decarboxylase [Woeseia sp.]
MQVTSQAQPNIALVKYWGKRDADRNLPATGSLSVTLDTLWTRMTVEFDGGDGDRLYVNGQSAPSLLSRVSRCLDTVAGRGRSGACIESECNFPIAAGLASSASSFAALVQAASRASGQSLDPLALARLAGQASGSAARSLYGGFVELRAGDDEIDVASIAAPDEWPLSVTVAVTERAAKPVSSGAAMSVSRESSPFYNTWVERQPADLDKAREAVRTRDFAALAAIAEHNCLKMHSVMWTSRPPIVYWNSATVACLETVRALQRDGIPVFFTIDAGPQVKAVSSPESADAVADALRGTAGVIDVLQSSLGTGARLVDPD